MIPFTPLKYPNDYENELYEEYWDSLNFQEQTQINTALESWLMSYLEKVIQENPYIESKIQTRKDLYETHFK